MNTMVSLSHGSGQGLNELISEVVVPIFYPEEEKILEDAAVLNLGEGKLAFTTDSFVVHPLEFPGGDIGKLAACGTINDLAMMGSVPLQLSVSLIIEEGLETDLLIRVLRSLKQICDQAHVAICCGDTKVVDRGKADKLFINTSGLGRIDLDKELTVSGAEPGDIVIVSGKIGYHGIAIMAQREGLGFASQAISDCAPLHHLVAQLLAQVPETKVLRDATRGGCAAVLNEIAESSKVSIALKESAIPVAGVVQGACSFLGLDPLQIANEGTMIAIVPKKWGKKALEALHANPLGQHAAIIGEVVKRTHFPTFMETIVGGKRLVETPPGELLPRIC